MRDRVSFLELEQPDAKPEELIEAALAEKCIEAGFQLPPLKPGEDTARAIDLRSPAVVREMVASRGRNACVVAT